VREERRGEETGKPCSNSSNHTSFSAQQINENA
jgi:hypothetical protein